MSVLEKKTNIFVKAMEQKCKVVSGIKVGGLLNPVGLLKNNVDKYYSK